MDRICIPKIWIRESKTMKKFTLRLDESLAKKLEQLAKKGKRSINNYLIVLIEKQDEKIRKKNNPEHVA